MKKGVVFATCIVCVILTCCTSNDKISSRKIVKLVNKNAQVSFYQNITTGYYEENDNNARYILRQLAANDIITYSCEQIPCKKKEAYKEKYVSSSSWFWGDTYSYRTKYRWVNSISHFVTVELTSKGKELVVDSASVQKKEHKLYLTRDESSAEINKSKFPETKVSIEETFDTIQKANIIDSQEKNQDTKKKSAYDIAKERESKVEHICKAYSLKAVKAQNIQITPAFNAAEAEVIIKVTESTPLGRIFFERYKGEQFRAPIKLTYYQDKGWTL